MKKNPLIAVTLFAILLSFISCHDSQQEIILEIHPSEVNLLKGEFYDLNTWNSMWDDNLSVVWSSSNSSIVSVDETGKIHALQEGEAQIIAQTENASASCNVVVEFDSLMCPSNLYLTLGEKLNLESPNYFYNFASHTYTDLRPIVLTSSNEEVIGITAQGEVEAKSIGKAVITITAGEVLSASCEIIVTGKENGYTWVDLGLSVKWATMNVGATKPEEWGDKFAWGETQPKKTYFLNNYKWYNGSNYTKYYTNDKKIVLEAADDAATANWGGAWRIPTKEEQEELINNCTWELITEEGITIGFKVTSKLNGSSIFLPTAGYRMGAGVTYSRGAYWSSNPVDTRAWSLQCHIDDCSVVSHIENRHYGLSVRPVVE